MMHATGLMSHVKAIAGRHPALKIIIDHFGLSSAMARQGRSQEEKATYRQCVTHFTEELKFLTEQDKEWIMGRGLAECLGWRL